MLEVIASAAAVSIFLEVYAFALDAVGIRPSSRRRSAAACRRGVRVEVILDGMGLAAGAGAGWRLWSSSRDGRARVRIYNRFSTLFLGRLRRDHRKILLGR